MKCPCCGRQGIGWVIREQGLTWHCLDCDHWFDVSDEADRWAREYDRFLASPPDPVEEIT